MKKGIVLFSLLSCFGLVSIANLEGKDAIASDTTYDLAFLGDGEDLSKSKDNFSGSFSVDENGLKLTRESSNASTFVLPNGDACSFSPSKTYYISLDVKSDGDIYFVFAINNPWLVMKESWLHSSTDYETWGYKLTPTSDVFSSLLFQLQNGSGNVFIKNFSIREVVETKSLKDGDPIGTLPSLDKKDGNDGVWTIDGNKISEESTFSYSSNKFALPSYPTMYSLSFYDDDEINKHQWMGTAGWWATSSENKFVYEDGILRLEMNSSTSIMHTVPLKEGETYRFIAKYKTNESTRFHLAWCNDWTNLLKANLSSSEWVELDWTFVAPKVSSISYLEVNVPAEGKPNGNIIEFQDIKLLHVSKRKIRQDEPIGDMLTPEGTSYYIDGKEINEDSLYSYSSDKEAYLAPIVTYSGNSIVTRVGRELDTSNFALKDFYSENIKPVYSFRWAKENDTTSLEEPSEPGNYTLYVRAKGSFGLDSKEINVSVTILEKDSTPPTWNKNNKPYSYPNNLTIEVIYLTYACFNLEAIDNVDGVISVSYDYGDTVDMLGRFVKSGLIKAIAKDSSDNASIVNINVVVLDA